METAIFGLIGVVIGAVLTTGLAVLKELWFKHLDRAKNSEYLAILITSMLERFIAGCADIVRDDGLYRGERNSRGELQTQYTVPSFDPLSAEVEWKALPAKLMNAILSFPLEIESARSRIEDASDNSYPPDFEEFYAERQDQFAKLGLRACKLADRLRSYVSLESDSDRAWNPHEYFRDARLKISANRQRAAEANAKTIESLGWKAPRHTE